MSDKLKLAILGSTRGTDMQYIIDSINSSQLKNASIEIVISNKPDAYILERARLNNIKQKCILSKGKKRIDFDRLITKELSSKKIDLIVLIGFMRILSSEFVEDWQGKIINVHPSLLPKFAGGMDKDVHTQVIQAGEKITGCTVHLVDQNVDTGKILLQKICVVKDCDSPASLKEKVQKLEGTALVEVIQNWAK